MGTAKATETKRKTQLFSVSFRAEDLVEMKEHLKDIKRKTGMELSRNELIRRAVLAHVRFKRDDGDPDYEEIFKDIS